MLNRLPGGWDEVRVRNNSAVALAAFVISVPRVPGSSADDAPLVLFSDPLIEPGAKPLAAGEERVEIRLGGPVRGPGLPHIHTLQGPVAAAGFWLRARQPAMRLC